MNITKLKFTIAAIVILFVVIIVAALAVQKERGRVCRLCGFDGYEEEGSYCYKVDSSGVVTLYPFEDALMMCGVGQ